MARKRKSKRLTTRMRVKLQRNKIRKEKFKKIKVKKN